jgi:hypothetical protein
VRVLQVIARRHGQDIDRSVVREREQIEELLANPLAIAAVEFRDQDLRAAEKDEKVLAMARGCFERLTAEQRDLVVKLSRRLFRIAHHGRLQLAHHAVA